VVIIAPLAAAATAAPVNGPELVLNDVREGYVSPESARSDNKVAVDPKTLEIDEEETRKLRQ
jgi:hypothetical protein